MSLDYHYTFSSNQGGRPYMEDVTCIKEHLTPSQHPFASDSGKETFVQETAYFGIFDGHGGSSAAAFAKDRLLDEITKHEGFWSEDDNKVMNAIKSGFESTHRLMWSVLDTWPRTSSGRRSTSGTTASVLFFRGDRLYVAHVGDSSVVLAQQNSVPDGGGPGIGSGGSGEVGSCIIGPGGGGTGSGGSGSVGFGSGEPGSSGPDIGGHGSSESGNRGGPDSGGPGSDGPDNGGSGNSSEPASDSGSVGPHRVSEANWSAVLLTKDHKPEDSEEKRRIEQSGGRVEVKAGVARVVWVRPKLSQLMGPRRRSTNLDYVPFLAIARSLGDLWSYNAEKDSYVVSPIPDVRVIRLVAGIHRQVVLASDGLWNVVTAEQTVKTLHHLSQANIKSSGDIKPFSPAAVLVRLALDRWLARKIRADNISVIVLCLGSAFNRPLSPGQPACVNSAKDELVEPSILRDISHCNETELGNNNKDKSEIRNENSELKVAKSRTTKHNSRALMRNSDSCRDCFRTMNTRSLVKVRTTNISASDDTSSDVALVASLMSEAEKTSATGTNTGDVLASASHSMADMLCDIDVYDVTVCDGASDSLLNRSHITDCSFNSPMNQPRQLHIRASKRLSLPLNTSSNAAFVTENVPQHSFNSVGINSMASKNSELDISLDSRMDCYSEENLGMDDTHLIDKATSMSIGVPRPFLTRPDLFAHKLHTSAHTTTSTLCATVNPTLSNSSVVAHVSVNPTVNSTVKHTLLHSTVSGNPTVDPTLSYASMAARHSTSDDHLLTEIQQAALATVSPNKRSFGQVVDLNATSCRRSSILRRRVSSGAKHLSGKPPGSVDRFRIPVTAEQRREYCSRRSSFGCIRLGHRLE